MAHNVDPALLATLLAAQAAREAAMIAQHATCPSWGALQAAKAAASTITNDPNASAKERGAKQLAVKNLTHACRAEFQKRTP